MGQPVRVVSSQLVKNNILRLEIDRSLTGMGHERFDSARPVVGDRPPEVLARSLFEANLAQSVHVFSNIITVTTAGDAANTKSDIESLVHSLFIHYRPGVLPTPVTTVTA